MAFVKTKCGTCNTEGLLTVNKSNAVVYGGWAVVLKYKSRKDDIHFKCKDEAEADECLNEINNALGINDAQLGGPIMG